MNSKCAKRNGSTSFNFVVEYCRNLSMECSSKKIFTVSLRNDPSTCMVSELIKWCFIMLCMLCLYNKQSAIFLVYMSNVKIIANCIYKLSHLVLPWLITTKWKPGNYSEFRAVQAARKTWGPILIFALKIWSIHLKEHLKLPTKGF